MTKNPNSRKVAAECQVEAIYGEIFNTRNDMRYTVSEYIEVDYNRHHCHSANGYISPEAFEARKLS